MPATGVSIQSHLHAAAVKPPSFGHRPPCACRIPFQSGAGAILRPLHERTGRAHGQARPAQQKEVPCGDDTGFASETGRVRGGKNPLHIKLGPTDDNGNAHSMTLTDINGTWEHEDGTNVYSHMAVGEDGSRHADLALQTASNMQPSQSSPSDNTELQQATFELTVS